MSDQTGIKLQEARGTREWWEHAKSTQKGPGWKKHPSPSCREATVLASAPLCHPSIIYYQLLLYCSFLIYILGVFFDKRCAFVIGWRSSDPSKTKRQWISRGVVECSWLSLCPAVCLRVTGQLPTMRWFTAWPVMLVAASMWLLCAFLTTTWEEKGRRAEAGKSKMKKGQRSDETFRCAF